MDKLITWMGHTREQIKKFPIPARQQAGHQLQRIQQGLLPTDWKPMSGIGPGISEIRLHEPHEHRVIYIAKFCEAVYVLHAFEKKSQKTSRRDVETAERAYREVIRLRRKL